VEAIGISGNPDISNDEKTMQHCKDSLKYTEGFRHGKIKELVY
jgi:hypothetical protein